jgi:site-specific DNA-methyltransferase (adenine-specific)
MQASWDKDKGGRDFWIAWMTGIARECLRATKPGGHALVWSLGRTSHWTAMSWEDAGWEVRDTVTHLQSEGFPKSHNPWKKLLPEVEGALRQQGFTGEFRWK